MAKSKAHTQALKLRDQMVTKFDDRSVMMASDMPRRPAVSSGSLALDFAIGIGGLPSDRYVEFSGAEHTGKTTLGLLAMSNFLDAQLTRCAVILDIEHKLDPKWLTRLVGEEHMPRVIYLQPDDAEQAVAMYKEAVGSGQVSFVLFDSIAAAEPRYGMENAEKERVGGNSKIMARFSRIAATFSAKYACCTFAVNQTRDDIEGFHRIITPGGRAPKHHQILRVQVRRGKGEVFETIDGEQVRVGYVIAAKVVKNQCGGIEGRTCQWWFMCVPTERYGFGVDQVDEITRLAMVTGVIERRGGWYYHPGLPDGKIQGADRFFEAVKANDGLRGELTTAIMSRLQEHAHEVAPVTDPEVPLEKTPVAEIFRTDGWEG
jgi:recombination protein RecA